MSKKQVFQIPHQTVIIKDSSGPYKYPAGSWRATDPSHTGCRQWLEINGSEGTGATAGLGLQFTNDMNDPSDSNIESINPETGNGVKTPQTKTFATAGLEPKDFKYIRPVIVVDMTSGTGGNLRVGGVVESYE